MFLTAIELHDLTDSHGKDAAQRLAVHSDARTTAGYYAGRKVVEV